MRPIKAMEVSFALIKNTLKTFYINTRRAVEVLTSLTNKRDVDAKQMLVKGIFL